MQTELLQVDRWNPDRQSILRATSILKAGGLVAFPTETVYGLGANGLDAEAVKKIYLAKGRPSDNPLILHVSSPSETRKLAILNPRAEQLMEAFWPGPLTLVLPALSVVPREVTGGMDTVALRMPEHPVTLALIAEAGFPLAGPSANRSGRPSPTDAGAVLYDLDGRIDAILDCGPTEVGVESTVLDVSGAEPLLLRPGGFSSEKLEEFLGVALGVPDATSAKRSPGTRYRHYAPGIPVRLWQGGELPSDLDPATAGFMGLDVPDVKFAKSIIFQSNENYARGVFAAFRAMEAEGLKAIVAQWPVGGGIALALRDRLRRASNG